MLTIVIAAAAAAAMQSGEDPLQCMIDRTPADFRAQFAKRIDEKLDPTLTDILPKSFEKDIEGCIPANWSDAQAQSLGTSWASAEMRTAAETILSRRYGIATSALDGEWTKLTDSEYETMMESARSEDGSAKADAIIDRIARSLNPRLADQPGSTSNTDYDHLIKLLRLYAFARANLEGADTDLAVGDAALQQ